ncbi:hypothetical protein K9U39_02950 [Rhodoblastus acidophilus]|uniref:Uncharacterized protein n=1 Tax=Candidatus Rhodoblastus alkanivorans TaxID=2954117 RepID=A0ABS9Z5Z1_9HYPH|nr:hypothetical protein [Candidatus Rhodoblastus alkanivorans]MCI4677661.1 hypothetical protein [Candidatus Rhodoblastus alkanivorans]MCI4682607.1 hypothetical protein [Candidatus Rhodoblastus alkanivorans]MDI4639913.1 hypothetical protein [Rhodoblastus acidophilus]
MSVAKVSGRLWEDFISRDVPAGHDTIWGWAAKWSPQDLPQGPDLKTAFAEEIGVLMRLSAANGCSVVSVPAPAALRAIGAEQIPAFETSLLYMMSRT